MTPINLSPNKGRHQAFIHGPALHRCLSGNRGPVALRNYLSAMHHDDRKGISAALEGLREGGIQSALQRVVALAAWSQSKRSRSYCG